MDFAVRVLFRCENLHVYVVLQYKVDGRSYRGSIVMSVEILRCIIFHRHWRRQVNIECISENFWYGVAILPYFTNAEKSGQGW